MVADQAYERAVHIANAMASATDGGLADVAGDLRCLQHDPGALPVQPSTPRVSAKETSVPHIQRSGRGE